jgi:hypothetical protein
MIPPTFGRISRSWCKTTTCQAPIPIPNCLFWPPPARFVALRLGRDANQSFIVPGLLRAHYPSKLGTALPSKWCACESPRAPMLMLCLATLAFVPPVDNRLGHLIAADPHLLTRLCGLLYGVPAFGRTFRGAVRSPPGRSRAYMDGSTICTWGASQPHC